MEKHIYRIYFVITINCGGIIKYTPANISTIGVDENDARKHFKEIIRIGKAEWNELKDAISIQKIEKVL